MIAWCIADGSAYLKYKGEIYIALSTTPICGNSLAGEKIKFDENGNQIGPVELTEENAADIAKKLNSYKF